MQEVKKGDQVRVHYTGKLTNGTEFDSSVGRAPLEFMVGGGQMIAGFDAALPGMKVGEKKTIEIAPENGYGHKNPEMIFDFPKDRIPEGMKLEVGMQLNMNGGQGQTMPVVVKEIQEEMIILDANHFLSGETLIFDIELVEIV
jgi:FKBP-type peptidyl-prolyl cis-trans isomerase 2